MRKTMAVALVLCGSMLVSGCGGEGEQNLVCWDNDSATLCFEGQPSEQAVCHREDHTLFCSSGESNGTVGSVEQSLKEPQIKLTPCDGETCPGGLPSYDCFSCWACLATGGLCALYSCPKCAGLF